jgi:ribonuclease HII
LKPRISGLNDSKKLSAKRREALSLEIKETALGIGIAHIPAPDIDNLGISIALRKAMLGALESTGIDPDAVLIDGSPMHIHPKEQCIIKGDGKIACIAAASIVAKVTRDALMVEISSDYPDYQWQSNKGYGSVVHIEAIKTHGLSEYHRQSFCRNYTQESLF